MGHKSGKRPRVEENPGSDCDAEEKPRAANTPNGRRHFNPRMNKYDHTDSNMVTATFELPGLDSGDITIDFLYNKVTVSGEISDNGLHRKGKYTSRELPYGKFSRTFTVALGLRPGDFKASMENGLLTLTFPKDPPKQEPHRIPIK